MFTIFVWVLMELIELKRVLLSFLGFVWNNSCLVGF